MAVKVLGKKKAKPYYEVALEDKELNEALSAKKEHLQYKDGVIVVPDSDKKEETAVVTEIPNTVTREEVKLRSEDLGERMSDQAMKEQRRKNRKSAGKRLFETIISVALVVMVGFFVMLLLYPQTELSELSRDNSDTKDRITLLKNQILDAEEQANGVTDMDAIRAQALALGMRDPNQNQVVSLPIPSNDNLTTVVSYDAYGVSKEAFDNAMNGLAEYYQTHQEQ